MPFDWKRAAAGEKEEDFEQEIMEVRIQPNKPIKVNTKVSSGSPKLDKSQAISYAGLQKRLAESRSKFNLILADPQPTPGVLTLQVPTTDQAYAARELRRISPVYSAGVEFIDPFPESETQTQGVLFE